LFFLNHGVVVIDMSALLWLTVNGITDKVCGVAELDGLIYVACHGSKTIQSFGSDDTSPRRHRGRPIDVDGLHEVCDLVACLTTRRLYVADERRLWVVSPTAHVKVSIGQVPPFPV